MKPPGKGPAIALLLVAAIAGIRISQSPRNPASGPASPANQEPLRTRASSPDLDAERESSDAAARRRIQSDWDELLRWLSSDPKPSPAEIRARLLETRNAWVEMDPHILAETLDRLLQSGGDLETGLDFKVGPQGFLSGWPTLRVFLLDVLAASDPEAAAATAGRVLATTTSADEFATALRPLTRKGRGRAGDAELLTHFGTMLDHPDWQRERGFAEALDLARFIGSAEAAARLAAWNGNPVLKTMAMDEFAAEHPSVMLDFLSTTPGVEGNTRANLMARADPADPDQVAAVERYLRDPGLPPAEAAVFLKSFPLRSATTGYRLYGKTSAPYTRAQITASDRAALDRVNQWADDPALGKYGTDIQALRERLTQWVRQAGTD